MSLGNLQTKEKVAFGVAVFVAVVFGIQLPYNSGANLVFGWIIVAPAVWVALHFWTKAREGVVVAVKPVEVPSIVVLMPNGGRGLQGVQERVLPPLQQRRGVIDVEPRLIEEARAPVFSKAKAYNPGKADQLLDCCANCVSRGICYSGQGELNNGIPGKPWMKWDFKCEEYGRDDSLGIGRVVDFGKKSKPKD